MRTRAFWPRVRIALMVAVVVANALARISYRSDQRFFSELATEILGMEPKKAPQVEALTRFVDYAYKELDRPSYDQLPSRWVRLYYRFNPFHPSARDVVRYGCDYRGGCGSSSRVVTALLEAAGIPSRVIVLRDPQGRSVHAVVNALVDNTWAVADPLYGLVFLKDDGMPATAEELKRDRRLFLENARRNPAYPHKVFNYENYSLLNWNKIPILLPAARRILVAVLGEEKTASIARPRFWMYPALAAAYAFTALAAAVLICGEAVRALTRRRAQGPSPSDLSRRS